MIGSRQETAEAYLGRYLTSAKPVKLQVFLLNEPVFFRHGGCVCSTRLIAPHDSKPVFIVLPMWERCFRRNRFRYCRCCYFRHTSLIFCSKTQGKRLASTQLARPLSCRGNVGQAVITVPAYFNDAQRQATKAAQLETDSSWVCRSFLYPGMLHTKKAGNKSSYAKLSWIPLVWYPTDPVIHVPKWLKHIETANNLA